MEIKQVQEKEIEQVMEIILDAKALLKTTSKQWQNGYPYREGLLSDIHQGFLYGAYLDEKLVGVIALVTGVFNVDYDVLEGELLIPYSADDLVVHRLAVKKEYYNQHIGSALMEYATKYATEKGIKSIKIDTHRLNLPMQRLCNQAGYHLNGIIHIKRVEPDQTRLLFEKSI